MPSSSNSDVKEHRHKLERQLQELHEITSLSRMAILNLQAQIDRLQAQTHTIHSQLDKIDKSLEKAVGESYHQNVLLQITQHHHSTQQKFDNLDTLLQQHLQEQKTSTEYLQRLEIQPNYSEHLNAIDQRITQLAVKDGLSPLYHSLHQLLEEHKTSLEQIKNRLDEQPPLSPQDLETVASKLDIGEVLVRLDSMQWNENERMAILGQRVSQMPTSHQLAQIYYKIHQSPDKTLLLMLWLILVLVLVFGFLFQPQIHETLGLYWSLFSQIAS